jgi:hypothetical protein
MPLPLLKNPTDRQLAKRLEAILDELRSLDSDLRRSGKNRIYMALMNARVAVSLAAKYANEGTR